MAARRFAGQGGGGRAAFRWRSWRFCAAASCCIWMGTSATCCTDGERIYLADFGLATSPRFDLSATERDFAERNITHDAGYAAMPIGQLAGDCGLRGYSASERRPGRPERVRAPVRGRPHSRWRPFGRRGDPRPARSCCREAERLLLEAVRGRAYTRSTPSCKAGRHRLDGAPRNEEAGHLITVAGFRAPRTRTATACTRPGSVCSASGSHGSRSSMGGP